MDPEKKVEVPNEQAPEQEVEEVKVEKGEEPVEEGEKVSKN